MQDVSLVSDADGAICLYWCTGVIAVAVSESVQDVDIALIHAIDLVLVVLQKSVFKRISTS